MSSVTFIPDNIVRPQADLLIWADVAMSPFNVRRHHADMHKTESLEASILQEGLLQPIRVHRLTEAAGRATFGVHAGGRRWRSIGNLIERGELPHDFPIAVLVTPATDEADLLEESIVENKERKDLRKYEECAGLARIFALGHGYQQIAERTGFDIEWVKQSVRVGMLAEPIFADFAAGALSLDQAKAYGATSDHERQLAAFAEHYKGPPPAPATIRSRLKVGDLELSRLLNFVGEGAYRDAGGTFELDLFADDDEHRGIVFDEQLLRDLAGAKIEEVRGEVRKRLGHPLRFLVKKPTQPGFPTEIDWNLQIKPTIVEEENGTFALPLGDVVGCIEIKRNGEAEVTYWWASRAAKAAGAAGPKPAVPARDKAPPSRPANVGAAIGNSYDSARRDADAVIREEAGISAETVQIFRSLRHAALRAGLVDDAIAGGDLALDYLVFTQLRLAYGGELTDTAKSKLLGARAFSREESDVATLTGKAAARSHIDASTAGQQWASILGSMMREPFMKEADPVLAFRSYRVTSKSTRQVAAAIVACLSLERSLNDDAYRVPLHDVMGAGLNLRNYIEPTAAFLDLLPTKERLAIVEPFVEAATFAPWSRLKSAELTKHVFEALIGAGGAVRQAMYKAATSWVHPLLRFGGADGAEQ